MTEKLTKKRRELLRSLVLDCQLRRFTTAESLAFIKDKLGVAISDTYYFRVRKAIVENAAEQLHYYQDNKNAFVATYFDRIAAGHKIEREIWSTYYESKEEKDRNIQLKCLLYLKEVGVYLNGLFDELPDLAGLKFSTPIEEKIRLPPFQDEVVKRAKYLKEQEFDDEAIF